MHLILDPYILTVPVVDADNQKWVEFAETLYLWSKEIQKQTHKFWLSWSVYDTLNSLGRYPTWPNLQSIAEKLPEDTPYDIQDVFSSCKRALTEPSFLEELALDDNHEIVADTTVVIPEAILARLPNQVSEALEDTLTYSAIISHQELNEIFSQLHFASTKDGFAEDSLLLSVKAYDVEIDEEEIIEESWPILLSPDQIASFWWEDTEKALHLAREKVNLGSEAEKKWPQWRVGPAFNASLLALPWHKKPKKMMTLFEKIAKMFLGEPPRYKYAKGINGKKNPHHPLKRGNDPITRDDGAEAWRLKVSRDYRLHYWFLPDKSIELSEVVYHEVYTIH